MVDEFASNILRLLCRKYGPLVIVQAIIRNPRNPQIQEKDNNA